MPVVVLTGLLTPEVTFRTIPFNRVLPESWRKKEKARSKEEGREGGNSR